MLRSLGEVSNAGIRRRRLAGAAATRKGPLLRPLTVFLACLSAAATPSWAADEDAAGLKLVGSDPLQGRSSYQLSAHAQDGGWLLYVGHHPGRAPNPLTGAIEENGMSVLDVTDPARPKYLHHEPPGAAPWLGDPAPPSGSYHFSLCDGADLPEGRKGRVYVLRTIGDAGHEVVDVTDPAKWRRVALVVKSEPSDVDGGLHTHNSTWDCRSGLAVLVASKAGWHATQIFQAFDLSDPENPRHIRDFNLPGSEPGAANPSGRALAVANFVNAAHAARIGGDRLYLAYNPFFSGTVQILDLAKFLKGDPRLPSPLAPTATSLEYPQIGRLDFPSYWGVHSAEPLLGVAVPDYVQDKAGSRRDLLFTLSEGTVVECKGQRHVVFALDITDPAYPTPISTYQADAGDGRYCSRFTYFGPHNVQRRIAAQFGGRLLLVTYFAAGLRVVDIRDPFRPVEVGRYIPAATENTQYVESKGPLAGRSLEKAALTNDVDVDSRGYIYISDRAATGLHILELSGEPARIAADAASTGARPGQ